MVLCHFTVTRYGKGTIGPHWVKTFLSWFSIEAQALDASPMTRSVRLTPEVRHAVLRELKSCDGKITDGSMRPNRMGVVDLDLDRECLLGHKYARYILTWHAATSICDYGLSMETAAGDELFARNHEVAMKLSGYCTYLLAFQPELVPDSTYTGTSMACGTLQNSRDFLAGCKSGSDKYKKLIELGRSDQTEYKVRFLSEGASIAVYLLERIADAGERWRVADFWANLMLYIAPSDRAVAHATRMVTGGEFVTIIWALLTHAHVVDQLQHRGGAPGLHIMLEEEEEERGVQVQGQP